MTTAAGFAGSAQQVFPHTTRTTGLHPCSLPYPPEGAPPHSGRRKHRFPRERQVRPSVNLVIAMMNWFALGQPAEGELALGCCGELVGSQLAFDERVCERGALPARRSEDWRGGRATLRECPDKAEFGLYQKVVGEPVRLTAEQAAPPRVSGRVAADGP